MSAVNIHGLLASATARGRLRLLLQKLNAFHFEPAPNFDLEDRVPLELLRRWTSLTERPLRHPVARNLNTLVQPGPSYLTDVPLRKVRAVTNSRGKYLMHLDTLPETMNLHKGESFGPLPPNELDRLRSSVFEEFGLANGRFMLQLQEWDQLYIAGNQGASRRFALWRRLTSEGPEVPIPAEVTPYRLNSELLRDLLYAYRAIGVRADVSLWSILREAGSVGLEFAYLDSADTFSTVDSWALFLIPYPHLFPKSQLALALDLHRRVERFFDLGRYSAECLSFAKSKPQ